MNPTSKTTPLVLDTASRAAPARGAADGEPETSFAETLAGSAPPDVAEFPPPVCGSAGAPQVEPAGVQPLATQSPAPATTAVRHAPHWIDPLDPASRHAAQLAPVIPSSTQPTASAAGAITEARARVSLESILPDLVRKVAWAGDGRKGSMRLELGAGALAGSTLVVHAEDGRVRIELDAPSGTDVAAWKARLSARLETRGVAVDELTVR